MTVICVKDGIMAADSYTFNGGSKWPSAFPKIARGKRGLLGLAGESNDCYQVLQWWSDEMPIDRTLLRKDDKSIIGLVLDNDGGVWILDERLTPHPTESLATIGNTEAASFCEGAMRFGASAEEAVKLAIQFCTFADGSVQVERLEK